MFIINRYFVFLYLLYVANASIVRSNNDCSDFEFRCDSGECIDDLLLCDGKSDCEDSSDEIEGRCNKLPCPRSTFRCNYGACVNRNAGCNGIIDCVDASDESPSLCGAHGITTASPPVRTCSIPGNIANGKYALNSQPIDEDNASNVSLLFVNCDEGYSNNPPETHYSICRNGVWIPTPPTCSQSCLSLDTVKYPGIRCEHQGRLLQSCANPIHGVKATGACFESRGEENCVYLCNYGNWEPVFSDQ